VVNSLQYVNNNIIFILLIACFQMQFFRTSALIHAEVAVCRLSGIAFSVPFFVPLSIWDNLTTPSRNLW